MIAQLPFLVTAFANQMRESSRKTAENLADTQAIRPHRDIGPIGTAVRLVVGFLLGGLIVYGQLSSSGHLTPTTWALGLIGFPALVLAWHFWRIRRNPARFSDTSALSFVLSIALPLALYLTGWFVPPLGFTSDATLIFVGGSLLLAALRGDAGCEFLALSNWLLRRSDQMACAIFTPIDSLEQRGSRS
jgi:hypothetical protein